MKIKNVGGPIKTLRRGLIGLVLFVVTTPVWSEVTLEVITDRYIVPVAELASTQTNPDVIVIKNEFVQVSLVPNRGRVIAELRSTAGVDFLSFVDEPEPVRGSDGVEVLEFGGFYSSVPWNSRVRQPYNLEYQVLEDSGQAVEIEVYGQDILTRVSVRWRIRLEDSSSTIEAIASMTNESSRRSQTIDLAQILYINRYGDRRPRRILLSSFEEIEVLDSENKWLGTPGSMVKIERIKEDWKTEGSYCVRATLRSEWDDLAWFDRGTREAFFWQWGGMVEFTEMIVCTSDDQIRVELRSSTIPLDPGETKEIIHTFSIVRNLSRNPTITDMER